MRFKLTLEYDGRPFLGVSLTFPPELVAKATVALADGGESQSSSPMPAFTARLETTLAETFSRLLDTVELRREFFANDGQFGRRVDANSHAAVADFYDGDGDLIANENSLADFSTEN